MITADRTKVHASKNQRHRMTEQGNHFFVFLILTFMEDFQKERIVG